MLQVTQNNQQIPVTPGNIRYSQGVQQYGVVSQSPVRQSTNVVQQGYVQSVQQPIVSNQQNVITTRTTSTQPQNVVVQSVQPVQTIQTVQQVPIQQVQQVPTTSYVFQQPVQQQIVQQTVPVQVTQYVEPVEQQQVVQAEIPVPQVEEKTNTIQTIFERPVYINREIIVENPVQRVINKVIEVDIPVDYIHQKIQQIPNEINQERQVNIQNSKVYEKLELFEDKPRIQQLENQVNVLKNQIKENNKLIVEYGLELQDFYNSGDKPIQQQFYPETSQYQQITNPDNNFQQNQNVLASSKKSFIPYQVQESNKVINN